jgi:hypothetical protein
LEEAMSPDRRQLPERRKEDYDKLDKKLDERFDKLTKRLADFIKQATIGIAIVGIACAVALTGYGFLLRAQHDTTQLIQDQRRAAILNSCTEQNERNAKTSQALIEGAALDISKRKTEAAKNEVRRRRDVTLGLINALAPKQDCGKLVAAAVKEDG